jgi:hypothetical protein
MPDESACGDQGWQVLPTPGFNRGFNCGLNRAGQNPKNPGKIQPHWSKPDHIKHMYLKHPHVKLKNSNENETISGRQTEK